jgi:hypothetical protein
MKNTLNLFLEQQKTTFETLRKLQDRFDDVIQSKECYLRGFVHGNCTIGQTLDLRFTLYPNEHIYSGQVQDKLQVYMEFYSNSVSIDWGKTKQPNSYTVTHIETIRDQLREVLNYEDN